MKTPYKYHISSLPLKEALYLLDDTPEGFEWINNISANDCYLTFLRKGLKKEDTLLIVANFSGIAKEITTGVPYEGKYKEILNTDAVAFGGSGIVNPRVKQSKKKEWDDREDSVTVKLAPLSLSILQYQGNAKPTQRKKKTEKR